MLSEEEWQPFEDLLTGRIQNIQAYRREHSRPGHPVSIAQAEANEPNGQRALDLYEALTAVRLPYPDMLWKVRLQDYGSLCVRCGKPFRTPRARMCAECGYELPKGRTAGPLLPRSE